MRNRVYSLTDLDDVRASTTVIDGWLSRAIVEVSALVDAIPQFWDSLSPLESVFRTTVDISNYLNAIPTNAIRIHPSIQIGPRMATLVKSASSVSNVKSGVRQPTVEAPQVCIVVGGVGSNYKVYPESFALQVVMIRYLSEPVFTRTSGPSFDDDIANAFAIKAAEIGSVELRDEGKAADMREMYKSHLESMTRAKT
jgi:hypothetical protein